jgi:hypothetical protein
MHQTLFLCGHNKEAYLYPVKYILCLGVLCHSTQDMLIGSIPVVGDSLTKQGSLFDLYE